MKHMTEEEMLKRIQELETENKRLKGFKAPNTILGCLRNQKELDFIFPYYREFRNIGWERSKTADFAPIRKMAISTVYEPTAANTFLEKKVKDLSNKDLDITVRCADELVSVIAKYKKEYLISVNREDIISAFNM